MSDLEIIRSTLDKARARRRLARGLRGLWAGLFWGAVVCLVIILTHHIYPIPEWTLIAAAAAPVLGALCGFIAGVWHTPSLEETARWVDLHKNLKERLSSAWELSRRPEGEWSHLVLSDAAAHAKKLEPRNLLPLSLPTLSRWALLVLALTAGLAFIPEYRSPKALHQQADKQNVQDAGRQLAELTRRSIEVRPPALESTSKALDAVMQTGEKLQTKRLEKSEALKELASISDKIKQDLDSLRKDPDVRRMEQAARSPTGGNTDPQDLQDKMAALKKELGDLKATPEALQNLKDKLEQMEKAAQAMTQNGASMSEAQKQQMQASLSALAKSAEAAGLDLPKLEEAIAALMADNPGLFLEALDQAVTDLENARQFAENLQKLQQQFDALGKDLAEQLERGQAEAAQSRLEKMAKQLAASGLTPEQAAKLMQEVAKAVDPAGNYGKVAEFLKQATGQMQNGERAAASESLAQAAEELEKLMQQMADARDLQEALENLKTASLCVGSGQRWAQCKNPGAGKAGGRNPGVGTWADDSNWLEAVENSAPPDNSVVQRPDMDGRGLTERDATLNESLTPTKVKGQFSPGTQMPSVTLKDMSIRGTSRVAFEEAAAAAQSEAQSALNQEKVPRAYQGPVRDYFDDIKQ